MKSASGLLIHHLTQNKNLQKFAGMPKLDHYNRSEEPSQHVLQSLFRYDEGIGALYRVSRVKYQPDRPLAGFIHSDGYWRIKIASKQFLAHRLIWVYHFGPVPAGFAIDHINKVRCDNHIENLRLATKIGNMQNQRLHKNNTSGMRNVGFEISGRSRWRYKREFAGRTISKRFRTKTEAVEYALKMEQKLQEFQMRPSLEGPLKEQQNGV